MRIHPDGLIFGTGESDGSINLWELASEKTIRTLEGFPSSVSSIAFSNNGYYMAACNKSNKVKVYDLRKTVNCFTIDLEEKTCVNRVRFDQSGSILGMANSNGACFSIVKTWEVFLELKEHSGEVTDIGFINTCDELVSCSTDKKINFYGLLEEPAKE